MGPPRPNRLEGRGQDGSAVTLSNTNLKWALIILMPKHQEKAIQTDVSSCLQWLCGLFEKIIMAALFCVVRKIYKTPEKLGFCHWYCINFCSLLLQMISHRFVRSGSQSSSMESRCTISRESRDLSACHHKEVPLSVRSYFNHHSKLHRNFPSRCQTMISEWTHLSQSLVAPIPKMISAVWYTSARITYATVLNLQSKMPQDSQICSLISVMLVHNPATHSFFSFHLLSRLNAQTLRQTLPINRRINGRKMI